MDPTSECPSPEELDQFLRSVSDSQEHAAVAAHLSECQACRRRAEQAPEHAAWADDLQWVNKLRAETAVDVNVPLSRLNELLDDYEIVEEIGRGGMGIVFRARHLRLDRTVALKVLPALLGAVRPDAIARFGREASLAARLQHTNIIPVFDFGEVDGTLYYTMPLIEGRSLREVLREINETGAIDVVIGEAIGSRQQATGTGNEAEKKVGSRKSEVGTERQQGNEATGTSPTGGSAIGGSSSLKPQASGLPRTRLGSSSAADKAYYRRVAEWIAEVAEALDYAHGQGVIHRDVKPSNLLLTADGRLMISDFGLARAHGVETLTVSRSLMGTARYMSPEQVDSQGGEIDHRADVYGLGATMYELLAFRPMFAAADDREVLDHVLNREPTAPHRFVRQVPRELETICLKAVEKDRTTRYDTAKALRDDLERWLLDLPIHARRPSLPARARRFVRRRKVPVALAAALVVVMIAMGLVYSRYLSLGTQAADAATVSRSQELNLVSFRAQKDVQAGRLASALAKLDEGLTQFPASEQLRCNRGAVLLTMNRWREATQYLEDTAVRFPDSLQAHYQLATIYGPWTGDMVGGNGEDEYGANRCDEAKAAYHRGEVERLAPDSAEALFLRARAEPDPQQAVALLTKAIDLDRNDFACVYERSQRFEELGRYDAMLLDAERAVAMSPHRSIAYTRRSNALSRLGRYEEAIRDNTRAIELDPDFAMAWHNRGVNKLKMGRFAQAIADFSEAIRLDPGYAPAYRLRARARAGLGNVEGALADLGQAIELDPRNVKTYLERALVHKQTGRWEDIIADSTRAIQLSPDHPTAWNNRAVACLRLERYERAIADLTRLLEFEPDNHQAWHSRGWARARSGQHGKAIGDFTQAISLAPDGLGHYKARANTHFRIGQYDEAIGDLTRVLELEPANRAAIMHRGMIQEISGAVESALADYNRAASEGGPTGEYARLWRHLLLRGSGQPDAAADVLAARESVAGISCWTDRLFDLLTDELASDDLLAAAVTDDERAEAYYYIGRKALLDSQPDEAKDAFTKCVNLDRNDVLETDFARACLRQLDERRRPTATDPNERTPTTR